MKEFTLRDYLRIIQKRKWWLVSFIILVPIFTFLILPRRQIPIYEAETTVKISSGMSSTTGAGGLISWWSPEHSINTEAQLVKSAKVVEKAAKSLGILNENAGIEEMIKSVKSLTDKIKTNPVENTDFITIKVRDSNSNFASAFANELAKAYSKECFLDKNLQAMKTREFLAGQLEAKELILKESEERLRRYQEEHSEFFTLANVYKGRLSALNEEISRLKGVYTTMHPKIKNLQREVDEIRPLLKDLPNREQEISALEGEVKDNKLLYDRIKEKLMDAEIVEQAMVEEDLLVTPAIPPTSPINPIKRTNIAIGVLAGLILGLIFVFVSESLDTTIRSIDEIESYLGIPVLGVVPSIKIGEDKRNLLLTTKSSDDTFFEYWHALCTNIEFATKEKGGSTSGSGGKLFLITSTIPREGKTSAAINIAIAMANLGKKTLLIDADVKGASIHRLFNIERNPGFTDVVSRNVELHSVLKSFSNFVISKALTEESISNIPGIDNLYIIGCGYLPTNPIQIFQSSNMSKVLEQLREEFDFVLFDTPPIFTAAATTVLASKLDWVLLVYQVNKVPRINLKRAVKQLSQAKAKTLGVVLSQMSPFDLETGTSYYYKYRYYSKEKRLPKLFRKS